MVWRDVQALHIYYPPNRLFPQGDVNSFNRNWGNEIIGKVIKPILEAYSIHWLWITRYNQPVQATPHLASAVPAEFQYHRQDIPDIALNAFILFRLSVEDKAAQPRTTELAHAAGYFALNWIPYDVVSDLGSDRFIHNDATELERIERARQLAMFMSSVATLLVYSLKEENGQWGIEPNSDKAQNPDNSFFQSVHHLFYNTTEVPLSVQVKSPFANISVPIRF